MKKVLSLVLGLGVLLAFTSTARAADPGNTAPLYNSGDYTCPSGAENTGGPKYGNVEMLLQGSDLVFTVTLTGATPSSSYDIWVNQDPEACPLGVPSFPGALTTDGSGNGSYSGSVSAVGSADNFWVSGVGGGQVLRSTALSEEAITDSDSDNVPDDIDNCPAEANPGQEDRDGDGKGDLCDTYPYDSDNDGVHDGIDLCPDTTADGIWLEDWGRNRWKVNENFVWVQNRKSDVTPGEPIAYTYGCNGHQILALLQTDLGDVMNGHRKFGLSPSVLEEFHKNYADGNPNGRYYVETVKVTPFGTAAYTPIPVYSIFPLVSGVNYSLEASGTYRFANWGSYGIADAAWNYRSAAYAPGGVAGWYQQASTRLQVWIGDAAVAWQPAEFNPSHVYTFNQVGNGSNLKFTISDDAYGDNSGYITVDIYAEL